VSEVVTAIVHAHTSIDFSLELDGESVVVSVRDENPTRPVRRQRTLDEAGGFGLRILGALAAAWGVETGPEGRTLWFSLPLRETAKEHPVMGAR
jgi:hypothetical protein